MQYRLIEYAEALGQIINNSFSRKKAQSIAVQLQQEIQKNLAQQQRLAAQLQAEQAKNLEATSKIAKLEELQKNMISVTQKQGKTIVEYQSFIKKHIPLFIEKAELVKNDIEILIVGLNTLNEHFNGILENLADYQLKNRTIIEKAQTTTTDLNSTSKIMDAVANDALEFQNKLPEFQNVIAQIKELSERLGVIVINAGIQSAHAGSFGNSFRVITQEIAKLNKDIQNTLLPQQESFIKEKIIPTIIRTTSNATEGNQKLHQNVDSLEEANTLTITIAKSLVTMIESIREVKNTIESFIENLTAIQASMDELVTAIKGIMTIQAEIFNYQPNGTPSRENPQKPSEIAPGKIKLEAPLKAPQALSSEKQILAHPAHIQWLDYKGKKILYFDFANHGPKDEQILIQKLREAGAIYKTITDNNIRVISNVTNCFNSERIFKEFKALREAGKDRILHSVLVGATGQRKIQAKILGAILGKLTIVDTMEQAKEFHATH